jgi:hypothetical protein
VVFCLQPLISLNALYIAEGAAPMRILLFILFCVAALWLRDLLFFKNNYNNEIWNEMNQGARERSITGYEGG